jgi:hypothetical protein
MAVTISMTKTVDGAAQATRIFDLNGPDGRKMGEHMIQHALAKVMAMAPDSTTNAGSRSVTFDWEYSMDGNQLATAKFAWNVLGDAEVGAIEGAFDGAMAKLDHHIAAKERKAAP